jgi:oligoendopeptidase F
MNDFMAKANRTRDEAHREIARVQTEKDLTVEAKGRRIAEIRTKANREIERLGREYAAAQVSSRDEAHRNLFGLTFKAHVTEAEKTAALSSYRDAIFRADALTDSQHALRMFGRGQMVGDMILMRAIAAVSYERGWDAVLRDYAATSETVSTALNELMLSEQRRTNLQARTNAGMTFSMIPETTEELTVRMQTPTLNAA